MQEGPGSFTRLVFPFMLLEDAADYLEDDCNIELAIVKEDVSGDADTFTDDMEEKYDTVVMETDETYIKSEDEGKESSFSFACEICCYAGDRREDLDAHIASEHTDVTSASSNTVHRFELSKPLHDHVGASDMHERIKFVCLPPQSDVKEAADSIARADDPLRILSQPPIVTKVADPKYSLSAPPTMTRVSETLENLSPESAFSRDTNTHGRLPYQPSEQAFAFGILPSQQSVAKGSKSKSNLSPKPTLTSFSEHMRILPKESDLQGNSTLNMLHSLPPSLHAFVDPLNLPRRILPRPGIGTSNADLARCSEETVNVLNDTVETDTSHDNRSANTGTAAGDTTVVGTEINRMTYRVFGGGGGDATVRSYANHVNKSFVMEANAIYTRKGIVRKKGLRKCKECGKFLLKSSCHKYISRGKMVCLRNKASPAGEGTEGVKVTERTGSVTGLSIDCSDAAEVKESENTGTPGKELGNDAGTDCGRLGVSADDATASVSADATAGVSADDATASVSADATAGVSADATACVSAEDSRMSLGSFIGALNSNTDPMHMSYIMQTPYVANTSQAKGTVRKRPRSCRFCGKVLLNSTGHKYISRGKIVCLNKEVVNVNSDISKDNDGTK